MQEEADAFIALPGGFGTVEELLEMITWQQLGIHAKPVGVLNICGFYDHLIAFADHMVEEVSYFLSLHAYTRHNMANLGYQINSDCACLILLSPEYLHFKEQLSSGCLLTSLTAIKKFLRYLSNLPA